MPKHNHHAHCLHVVKWCERCDITYCSKCSKEWGAPCNLYHGPTYWPWWSGTTYNPPYYFEPVGTTTISSETNTLVESGNTNSYTMVHSHN